MTVNTEAPSSPIAPLLPSTEREGAAPHAHSVQFYEEDRFLLEELSRFIGAALGAGEAGVRAALLLARKELGWDEALAKLFGQQGGPGLALSWLTAAHARLSQEW